MTLAAALSFTALALLLSAPPVGAPPAGETTVTVRPSPPDELTAAVVGYPFTLARLESYAATVRELRGTAERSPALARRLRALNGRTASLSEAAARFEAIPEVKAALAKRGLTTRDFVLMPTVVLASRMVVLAERSGHPVPPDRVNRAAVAVVREHGPRVDEVTEAFMADLRVLGGP